MSLLLDEFENLALEIQTEVQRAKDKFPSHTNLGYALMEEVGEFSRAVIQQESKARQRREAVQVMAVCYRIITEGDASLDVGDEARQK